MEHPHDEGLGNNRSGQMLVKVMTDEQMELLRKQIAVYATISQQLVHSHTSSFTSHYHLQGVGLGNNNKDPLIESRGYKFQGGRQRWTPTPLQLEIIKRALEEENGNPNRKKIKEITSELSQHGQIYETNVYNWFQNRRTRSKRKQQARLIQSLGPTQSGKDRRLKKGESVFDASSKLAEVDGGEPITVEGDSRHVKLRGVTRKDGDDRSRRQRDADEDSEQGERERIGTVRERMKELSSEVGRLAKSYHLGWCSKQHSVTSWVKPTKSL